MQQRRHITRLVLFWSFCLSITAAAAPSPQWVQEAAQKLVAHQKTEGWPKTSPDTILKTLNSAHGPVEDSALLQAGLQETFEKWGLPEQSILSPNDFTYWLLKSQSGKAAEIRDTGIWPLRRGKRWYAQYVLKNSPADKAGLVRGDELVTLNGKEFSPHALFAGSSDELLRLAYRRQSWEEPRELKLKATKKDPALILREAMTASELLVEQDKKKVGYLHLWWMGDKSSLEALGQSLRRLNEKADAIVLDLRDSVPIRKAGLLGMFLPQQAAKQAPLVTKPLVLLVNSRTAGIAEWLAGMLQKEGRARLVGTATAGEFLETRSYWLAGEQWLLRVPMNDPEGNVPFHQGQPLQPNVVAHDDLVFSGGTDSLVAQGINLATETKKR